VGFDGHPPVRELLSFEIATLEAIGEDRYRVVATGKTDRPMPEIAIEPVDEPGIPEPQWVRLEVVGYHFGDQRPEPTEYRAETEVTLPPGAIGVELVGADRTEQLPVIFEAEG
jgi:hypothetical protein